MTCEIWVTSRDINNDPDYDSDCDSQATPTIAAIGALAAGGYVFYHTCPNFIRKMRTMFVDVPGRLGGAWAKRERELEVL